MYSNAAHAQHKQTNKLHTHTHTNIRKPTHVHIQDLSKKLKDEGGGLDLMGYIELQRCARA